MRDYIFFMHAEIPEAARSGTGGAAWEPYLASLRASGRFQGGSSIGDGVCVSKADPPGPVTSHISGYIRVQAHSLDEAKTLLEGNPVFEAGGTVEIRELPRD
jgi:hypothetical protein